MRIHPIAIFLTFLMVIALGAGCYEDTVLQTESADSFDEAFVESVEEEGFSPAGEVQGEEDVQTADDEMVEGFDDDGVDENGQPTDAGMMK